MAIIGTNYSRENFILLSEAVKEVLEWEKIKGFYFDSRETQLQHFSCRHFNKDPTTTPSVT